MSPAAGQKDIVFQNLHTTNGLSYGGLNGICTDVKGNLWIATGNGLNMFNGKVLEKYFATEYPQMDNSIINQVTCDSSNRIWILTEGGHLAMLDEKRKMHAFRLNKSNAVTVNRVLNSPLGDIILFTGNQFYLFNNKQAVKDTDELTEKHFTLIPIKYFDTIPSKRFSQVIYYSDNNFLFVNSSAVYKINFTSRMVESSHPFSSRRALAKWGQNGLLVYNLENNRTENINLSNQTITYPFEKITDQNGEPFESYFHAAEKISNHQYLFTTLNRGIFIFDSSNQSVTNYRHNSSNPFSLANNTCNMICTGQKGWVFITCNPAGVSYFNVNENISNQFVFSDDKGTVFDGYISGIASADNKTYYFGTVNKGLLQWKRKTNTSTFINFNGDDGKSIFNEQEIRSVLVDGDNIWATARNNGLVVLNNNLQLLKHLKNEAGNFKTLKQKNISYLQKGPDGFIWACGGNGISRIHPQTLKVDNFQNSSLSFFDSAYVTKVIFINEREYLIAAGSKGLFHYNAVTGRLAEDKNFAPYKRDGIWDIEMDSFKNIYVANVKGLVIIFTNGRVKSYTQKNGLLINRAEGLLPDNHNRMWIGNDIGLVCYNPADSSLKVFDVRYGISIYGFRVGSYHQMPNGEFFLGTPKGIQYFHPDSLFNKKVNLHVSITKLESKEINSSFIGNTAFTLKPGDNQVTFYFGTVDYSQYLRTYYQYKLVDLDKDWIKVADQNSVRYNSLAPGKYIFKVRVSNDNVNWQESDNEVTVFITAPYYQTWWFKTTGALLGIAVIAVVINYYRKQQLRQREQLETELVINYFASQINQQQNTDALLWDVAKNCISRLNFADCVIYLKDEERNVLVQKAAYGPKNPVDYTIHQPIEITVGKGITGTVAATGIAEVINNTELDARYIVDDSRRFSEISIPILSGNKVIGVIDSEHPRKNFFTAKHLQILSTIAVLCANQLQKIKADEEKQKATIELLENKRRAMESRLQSLRLQMNPHFLFNALNSVQQMILANEEMVATRYLSRFSKLLRTILIHSDKETISLREEMEMLNLYVELESVRFKEAFDYKIICGDDIDADEIKIPTLLIQPFVENAIWHGLMHKENNRLLMVKFTDEGNYIKCIVEDNGIGRKNAAAMKLAAGAGKHTSKGIKVSEERLKAMGHSGTPGSVTIIDLLDNEGNACGTRVEIIFPNQI